MTPDDVYAICRFLGSRITDEQTDQLMDGIRMMSIADREEIMSFPGLPDALFTEMSMHNAEMGSLNRY